ncbi:hypothetical protein JYU34_002717 [Plutella xylostella]|uniref:Uncharacterized protein n=1 Tax=Plutella xylostella TaxID=51655 RepID=A0ABQ7R2Y8_PLUXY|nr:hypothetical protein JYU34_002717 [Plutella xylostella]
MSSGMFKRLTRPPVTPDYAWSRQRPWPALGLSSAQVADTRYPIVEDAHSDSPFISG